MQKGLYFHYTTIKGLKGIICDKCFYATHINFLNDSSEDKYFKSLIEEYLLKNTTSQKIFSDLHDFSYEEKFDKNEKYIISFSERPDSLSMWNYYAKGNGYNLGIKIDNIMSNIKKVKFISQIRIIYDKKEQYNELDLFFNYYKNDYEEFQKLSFEMDNYKRLGKENEYQNLFLEQSQLIVRFMDKYSLIKKQFKHPAFADEKEVRLVVEPYEQYYSVSYRITSNKIVVPYIIIPINIIEDIFSVTLHPLQNETSLNGLKHFLDSKKLNIKVIPSEIPLRKI